KMLLNLILQLNSAKSNKGGINNNINYIEKNLQLIINNYFQTLKGLDGRIYNQIKYIDDRIENNFYEKIDTKNLNISLENKDTLNYRVDFNNIEKEYLKNKELKIYKSINTDVKNSNISLNEKKPILHFNKFTENLYESILENKKNILINNINSISGQIIKKNLNELEIIQNKINQNNVFRFMSNMIFRNLDNDNDSIIDREILFDIQKYKEILIEEIKNTHEENQISRSIGKPDLRDIYNKFDFKDIYNLNKLYLKKKELLDVTFREENFKNLLIRKLSNSLYLFNSTDLEEVLDIRSLNVNLNKALNEKTYEEKVKQNNYVEIGNKVDKIEILDLEKLNIINKKNIENEITYFKQELREFLEAKLLMQFQNRTSNNNIKTNREIFSSLSLNIDLFNKSEKEFIKKEFSEIILKNYKHIEDLTIENFTKSIFSNIQLSSSEESIFIGKKIDNLINSYEFDEIKNITFKELFDNILFKINEKNNFYNKNTSSYESRENEIVHRILKNTDMLPYVSETGINKRKYLESIIGINEFNHELKRNITLHKYDDLSKNIIQKNLSKIEKIQRRIDQNNEFRIFSNIIFRNISSERENIAETKILNNIEKYKKALIDDIKNIRNTQEENYIENLSRIKNSKKVLDEEINLEKLKIEHEVNVKRHLQITEILNLKKADKNIISNLSNRLSILSDNVNTISNKVIEKNLTSIESIQNRIDKNNELRILSSIVLKKVYNRGENFNEADIFNITKTIQKQKQILIEEIKSIKNIQKKNYIENLENVRILKNTYIDSFNFRNINELYFKKKKLLDVTLQEEKLKNLFITRLSSSTERLSNIVLKENVHKKEYEQIIEEEIKTLYEIKRKNIPKQDKEIKYKDNIDYRRMIIQEISLTNRVNILNKQIIQRNIRDIENIINKVNRNNKSRVFSNIILRNLNNSIDKNFEVQVLSDIKKYKKIISEKIETQERVESDHIYSLNHLYLEKKKLLDVTLKEEELKNLIIRQDTDAVGIINRKYNSFINNLKREITKEETLIKDTLKSEILDDFKKEINKNQIVKLNTLNNITSKFEDRNLTFIKKVQNISELKKESQEKLNSVNSVLKNIHKDSNSLFNEISLIQNRFNIQKEEDSSVFKNTIYTSDMNFEYKRKNNEDYYNRSQEKSENSNNSQVQIDEKAIYKVINETVETLLEEKLSTVKQNNIDEEEQINNISKKVMRKIEKNLSYEKRRRGLM
ncbi:hypothetical protein, partial [uncultured Clostridium sp.]|uniref:hypothetical protein n=1 Tax=uncultured Clostridium sp. TaxID=59620 RepID=UPI0025E9DA3E